MSTFRYRADINLDALEHNILEIRRRIGSDRKLCCVLKANGYGHGSVMLAKFLENLHQVDFFATACVDEAMELKDAGITLPMLILGETWRDQYKVAITNQLRLTVFSMEDALLISEAAQSLNIKAKIHIKIDTGMGRIGFLPCKATVDDIVKISQMEGIELEGMFTHFACADMVDRQATKNQICQYNQMIQSLEELGVQIPIKHSANSAGIMEYEEAHMDMVRAGIILYGLYPSDEISKQSIDLQPVMSLKSHVTYVKTVPEETTVSYGSTFVTNKESVLATIPVGYADGYFRSLSNKGYVLIHGQKAPICGRVCMDQMVVDVTHISQVVAGDEVTIVGRDQNSTLPVETVADMAGSFNYEFVCAVSRRVPRVYYRNGIETKIVSYLKGDN